MKNGNTWRNAAVAVCFFTIVLATSLIYSTLLLRRAKQTPKSVNVATAQQEKPKSPPAEEHYEYSPWTELNINDELRLEDVKSNLQRFPAPDAVMRVLFDLYPVHCSDNADLGLSVQKNIQVKDRSSTRSALLLHGTTGPSMNIPAIMGIYLTDPQHPRIDPRDLFTVCSDEQIKNVSWSRDGHLTYDVIQTQSPTAPQPGKVTTTHWSFSFGDPKTERDHDDIIEFPAGFNVGTSHQTMQEYVYDTLPARWKDAYIGNMSFEEILTTLGKDPAADVVTYSFNDGLSREGETWTVIPNTFGKDLQGVRDAMRFEQPGGPAVEVLDATPKWILLSARYGTMGESTHADINFFYGGIKLKR